MTRGRPYRSWRWTLAVTACYLFALVAMAWATLLVITFDPTATPMALAGAVCLVIGVGLDEWRARCEARAAFRALEAAVAPDDPDDLVEAGEAGEPWEDD